MYMDTIVFAGFGTVGLMIAFFGGVYYFLRKDAQKHK
ncbi:hypothetical protein BCF53_108124 [Reinekea marinisedimentorum]|uniref:ATP-dependent helicase n=1 Tax=Reinekea marinisedimentorum TaxID=230495 RepID=A0A4V2UJM7_9GAMM|nr:hypothetical protein BCF53_108124 [Reinekea marinisedimentorum]